MSTDVRATAEHILRKLTGADRRFYLLLLFVVALAIRLGALFALRNIGAPPGWQAGWDGIDFCNLGRALSEGRGFVWPNGAPTSFRAPGFPMFLALVFRASHGSYAAAILSFAVLGAIGCIATYLLGREVVPEPTARLAALLATVYFPAIYLGTIWVSETLFIACFALSLWLFLVHLRTSSNCALVAAGLLLSFSILVRPFVILVVPVLLVVELKSRRRVLACLAFAVCCALPVSLWTARNYRVHHAFVLVATNGGSTFYGGNNDIVLRVPRHMGGWVSTGQLPGRALVDAAPSEVLHDKIEWQLGIHWVRAHALQMPVLIALKLIRLLLPEVDSANKKFVIVSVLAYLPMLALLLLGICAALKGRCKDLPWAVLHLSIAATVVTAIIFWGSPRFRDANMPILMIYAACGIEMLIANQTETSDQQLADTQRTVM